MSINSNPYYLKSSLGDMEKQKALTTGMPLDAKTAYGITSAELDERYNQVNKNADRALAQQNADRNFNLALQAQNISQDQYKSAQKTAGIQSIVSGAGAAGQMALGYGALKNAGVFGAKEAATATGKTALTTAATPTTTQTAGEVIQAGLDAEAAGAGGTAAGAWGAETAGTVLGYDAAGEAITVGMEAGAAGAEIGAWGTAAAAAPYVAAAIGVYLAVSYISKESIICTELNRQGHLSDRLLEHSRAWRVINIDNRTYGGYLLLATPIVWLMRKSKLFSLMVKPFVVSYANEAANSMDKRKGKSNLLGRIVINVGKPICSIVGTLKPIGLRSWR